jgi:cytochrome c oxidase subunit IV
VTNREAGEPKADDAGAHGSGAHGPGAHASVGTYLTIAAVLTAVTALEVGVIYVRRLAPVIVPLLLAMSAAKFALVVLFFMHLRYDARPLKVLFFGPLVIAVGLAIALMTLHGEFLVFGR